MKIGNFKSLSTFMCYLLVVEAFVQYFLYSFVRGIFRHIFKPNSTALCRGLEIYRKIAAENTALYHKLSQTETVCLFFVSKVLYLHQTFTDYVSN